MPPTTDTHTKPNDNSWEFFSDDFSLRKENDKLKSTWYHQKTYLGQDFRNFSFSETAPKIDRM